MQKEKVKQNYQSFIKELEDDFRDKEAGYVKTIKIGRKIFPYSIPPQLEIVLLDPEDQSIVFRRASDPESLEKKKGKWNLGSPLDAVCCAIDWAELMKEKKQTTLAR